MDIKYMENALTADDYIAFQRRMGYTSDPIPQVEKSLAHQLSSVVAVKDDEIIGMGRLMGDAAIYWYINDVWVLPAHRGQGIGTAIVNRLVAHAKTNSITGTSISVCLMAAQGKEGFYERLGFRRRPHEYEGAGMEMEIDV